MPIDAGDAPEDVLGLVAAGAKVEDVAEVLLLEVRGDGVPVVCDGIADEDGVVLRLGLGLVLP